MEATQIGKKRPREPPSPTPTLQTLLPQVKVPLFITSLYADKNYHAALSECGPELGIEFIDPLMSLAAKGKFDRDSAHLLRTEKLFKKSWDSDENFSIYYGSVFSGSLFTPDEMDRIKPYFNKAGESSYFDVPPPAERPDVLHEGFYILYPDGPAKDDPALEGRPNVMKHVTLMSKLGRAAVVFHNFITGSKLDFLGIKKANLFFGMYKQFYFITLEAKDKKSGKKFNCQSRVFCQVRDDDWRGRNFTDSPVSVEETHVESFRCVECSD